MSALERIILATFGIVGLLIGPIGEQSAHADTVVVSADYWFPFNGEPGSEKPGYMIEIADRVLAAKGHTLEYRKAPWTRSIQDMMNGSIDGIVGAARGDAPDAIFPTESLGNASYNLFVPAASSWRFTGLPSLAAVSLGVITDYSYGELFDPYIAARKDDSKRVQFVGGDSALSQNIQKLRLGRIGALLSVPEVFWTTIDELKLDRTAFVDAGGDSKRDPLYIAFSPAASKPRSKEYARILSEGVADLRAAGELQRILDRYGLKDWQ